MMFCAMDKKAVHFGAGNIGRGFIACFLHNSGYEIVFADVIESLVSQLNTQKSYNVTEVGSEEISNTIITNYRAINLKTHETDLIRETASADIVTCAVGTGNLKAIAPIISRAIDMRPRDKLPLAIIACENTIGATDILEGYVRRATITKNGTLDVNALVEGATNSGILDKEADGHEVDDHCGRADGCGVNHNGRADGRRVNHNGVNHNGRARYANCAIDRIVPTQQSNAQLDVKIEKFYEWVVDRRPFADYSIPYIRGVEWVDNVRPYIERKLYTLNTGHATAAYYGYNRGKRFVHEALQDPFIFTQVNKVLRSTSNLVVKKFGIPEQDQEKYAREIIVRISNPHLKDTVERVGRAPLRKMGRTERLVGPASELVDMGYDCSALLGALEMAFRFQNVEGDEESKELARIIACQRPDEIVTGVCGLQPSEKLYPQVLGVVKRVQADR